MEILKFFSREKKSKNLAKERLKMVLIHDRSNVSPLMMDKIREDIVAAVSKYIEVDTDSVDLKFSRSKKDMDSAPTSALVANIPIIKIKEESKE